MIRCDKRLCSATMVVVAALALVPIGCGSDAPAQSPEDSMASSPVPVRCVAARVATLHPSIDLVGALVCVPEKTVVLSTQIPGQIQLVRVVEGQHVPAGDDILGLDGRSAEIQRAKTHAAVEEARAIVARLKNGSRAEDIEVARQELHKAQTSLNFVRTKLESGAALIESHVIPEQEFAQRKAAQEEAEAELAARQANLRVLEIGARPEEIAEAEAKLAGADADLAASELALKLTRVTAPIDGTVIDLPVRQGMFVSSGTTLLTMADLSILFARVRVPAAMLADVREGEKVDVRVASYADCVFPGTIARLGKQADVQTGDVDALASVPDPEGKLRPGLTCRLRIWLPEIREVLAIQTAGIADRDGTPVATVVRDGRAHEVEVRLGGRTNEWVQVLSGLEAGDLVAVEGGYGLPDGCPCKVLLESSAAASPATASP